LPIQNSIPLPDKRYLSLHTTLLPSKRTYYTTSFQKNTPSQTLPEYQHLKMKAEILQIISKLLIQVHTNTQDEDKIVTKM
jgi:hypothetical protein